MAVARTLRLMPVVADYLQSFNSQSRREGGTNTRVLENQGPPRAVFTMLTK